MKIYFKLTYNLSYSESENLFTWGRERRIEKNGSKQVYLTSQGQAWLELGWKEPGGCLSLLSPLPPIHTLSYGWVEGGWSGDPWHPDFVLCCVHMYVCVLMCAHMSAYVHLCVCTYTVHMSIWVHHITILILLLTSQDSQSEVVWASQQGLHTILV